MLELTITSPKNLGSVAEEKERMIVGRESPCCECRARNGDNKRGRKIIK
jgi:hypothetical protein